MLKVVVYLMISVSDEVYARGGTYFHEFREERDCIAAVRVVEELSRGNVKATCIAIEKSQRP